MEQLIRAEGKSNKVSNIQLHTFWGTGIVLSGPSDDPYEMYFRTVYLREKKERQLCVSQFLFPIVNGGASGINSSTLLGCRSLCVRQVPTGGPLKGEQKNLWQEGKKHIGQHQNVVLAGFIHLKDRESLAVSVTRIRFGAEKI